MDPGSDSDDSLDPLSNEDGVVSQLQRKELTKFPSVEASNPVPDATQEDCPVAPSVMMVDETWKSQPLRLIIKKTVLNVPFSRLIHAPAVSRDGVPLSRVSMPASKFCESGPGRLAVAKALVNEHGANYIASRLIFVKMITKQNAATAFLPVTLDNVDGSEEGAELTRDGAVPIFTFPKVEVEALLKPSTSSTSAIPKEFAKFGGAWDLVQPTNKDFSGDEKKRAPKQGRVESSVDSDPPPAKKAQPDERTPAAAPPASPVEETAPPAENGLPAAVNGGALEAFSEAVTKTFLLKPDDKERTQLPITIPPGVVARVTVELRAA